MSKTILKKVLLTKQIQRRDFLKFLPARKRKVLLKQASYLSGKRVVHINATATGGGVAEILKSLIPYLRSLGISGDWYCISSNVGKNFFVTTNKIHNALQGSPVKISAKEWSEYERVNKLIAAKLDKIDCDILVINDPQPLLAGFYSNQDKPKIYFSHIDTSVVFKPVWKKLLPFLGSYERIIFSNCDFTYQGLPRQKIRIFTPAIDPLSPKQQVIAKKAARGYLRKHGGIPTNCFLVAQISRFDIWKNPTGLIQAFRLVQNTYPKVRLALVGFKEAKDNAMATSVHKDVVAVASKSPEIYLFFDQKGKNISEFTVMTQNGADVIVQNSTKEGFGLVVAEAMWKRQPVIGGPASGICRQIRDGKNGFITKNSEELAKKIIFLLSHPKNKKKMGESARKTVAEKFLFPRLVLDHLKLYRSCLK